MTPALALRVPLLAALVLLAPAAARGQLSLFNLAQGRSGNLPYQLPENRYDLYDQLNLDYTFHDVRLGLRYETSRASDLQYEYGTVTQRFAEASTGHSRLRIGNFYTILGRGLIHRSFEIPGVILDQAGSLAPYAQARDMDGVLGEFDAGPVSGRAFGGAYNIAEVSPAQDTPASPRHAGHTSGAQLVVHALRGSQLGVAYLRDTGNGIARDELGSGFASVDPLALAGVPGVSLPVYVEYAQRNGTLADWWKFRTTREVPHALYAGMNLLAGRVSVSAEWKDYSGFRLGTNDPPSLVKEHGAPLLNRATHVLDAAGERGYQLETAVRAGGGLTFTGNLSRADGRNDRRFEERYLEAHAAARTADAWEATAFVAGGKDASDGIERRRIQGFQGSVRLPGNFSFAADIEHQSAERRGLGSFSDVYLSGTVLRASRGSVGLVWQHTTDPLDLGPPGEDGVAETSHDFLALVAGARLGEHHDATLTVGERRGGLACTAGTCYQVVPFKGAALRLESRF